MQWPICLAAYTCMPNVSLAGSDEMSAEFQTILSLRLTLRSWLIPSEYKFGWS